MPLLNFINYHCFQRQSSRDYLQLHNIENTAADNARKMKTRLIAFNNKNARILTQKLIQIKSSISAQMADTR